MTTEHLDQKPGSDQPVTPDAATPVRWRAGKRWWALAAAAVVVGSLTGVTASYLARPSTTLHATSNKIITSTGGVFTKETGQVAPVWSLPDLRNPSTAVALAQFKGHPVVVNFWASWCPPCRKEMPALEATARRLAGKVDFVGVDTNDKRSAALSFAAKTGVSYPLVFDPRSKVGGNYGVYGLPTTFFVSAQGKLLGRQVGGMTEQRLAQLINQTFKVPVAARAGSPG
ncbi:MAG: TlpA disulfide reductase family protein [Actinomycetota bacterium]|nr:TlpA disulfide reductase family protein [Actinomycetota bacterium]